MSRPHDYRYRTRVAKHTPPVTGGGAADSQTLRPRSTSIATRKITRYSSAAFKSTSWELKRQSSEKFLRVAGVLYYCIQHADRAQSDNRGISTKTTVKMYNFDMFNIYCMVFRAGERGSCGRYRVLGTAAAAARVVK